MRDPYNIDQVKIDTTINNSTMMLVNNIGLLNLKSICCLGKMEIGRRWNQNGAFHHHLVKI